MYTHRVKTIEIFFCVTHTPSILGERLTFTLFINQTEIINFLKKFAAADDVVVVATLYHNIIHFRNGWSKRNNLPPFKTRGSRKKNICTKWGIAISFPKKNLLLKTTTTKKIVTKQAKTRQSYIAKEHTHTKHACMMGNELLFKIRQEKLIYFSKGLISTSKTENEKKKKITTVAWGYGGWWATGEGDAPHHTLLPRNSH